MKTALVVLNVVHVEDEMKVKTLKQKLSTMLDDDNIVVIINPRYTEFYDIVDNFLNRSLIYEDDEIMDEVLVIKRK